MSNLITPTLHLSLAEGRKLSENQVAAMAQIVGNHSGVVGLLVDSSIDGVLLTLAAIYCGLNVAICHRRDPPAQIVAWLNSLNATCLLANEEDELASHINLQK